MATTIYNKNNMSTSEVKKMQQALVDKGYSVGSSGVDGIWGKDTAAALSQYKTDIGQNNSYGTTVGNSTLNQLYAKPTTPNVPAIPYTPTASQYDSKITGFENKIAGYDNAITNAYTGYQNIATMLGNSSNEQNAALQQAMGATADQINSLYDNSARDYYRLYKTQQKALPENLSRAGVTGGASESSQLKLMNAYSDNLFKNESARDNALAGNTADYQNKIAQNSIAVGNQLAGYYQNMLNEVSGLENLKTNTNAELQQAIADRNAASAVDKWNASIISRVEKQLGREGGDTLWTYQTPDGKLHWTTKKETAEALSSQYKLDKHSTVPTSKKASSGSGSGSANTTKSTTTSPSYSYKTLEQNMTNALIKGATKEQLLTYVDPIEAAYNNGSISETETQKLLNMLK